MLTRTLTTARLGAAALALILAASGCSDSTDPGDEHVDAAGLVAELVDGTVLASVNADREVTGSFTVPAGAETDLIHIHFLDENGVEMTVDEAEFYLEAEVDDAGVVAIQQDLPGGFEVHIVGVAAGTSNIRFKLMHGQHPDGHPDYTSPNIPVTVTAAPGVVRR